jgi:hypothetical protein
VTFRLCIGNVNSGFRSTTAYRAAIPGMARVFARSRSSVRFINEAGDQDDCTRLCNAFGDEWRYTRATGSDVRLGSAIHWDRKVHRLLEGGRFDISSVVTHDTACWAIFRHIGSDVTWLGVTALLWPFPIGPNNTAKDDKIRSDAARSMLRQARATAKGYAEDIGVPHVPLIAGSDWNHPANDKPDVIGAAFDAYNLTDTDLVADKRINGWASTHAKPGGLQRGGRIDRIARDDRGVNCREQETLYGYPSLDHNPVVVSLDVTNK